MIRSGSRKCSRRKHRHCPIQHTSLCLFNELRNSNGKNRYRPWMIVVRGRKRKLSFTRSFALPAQGWLRLRDDSFRIAGGQCVDVDEAWRIQQKKKGSMSVEIDRRRKEEADAKAKHTPEGTSVSAVGAIRRVRFADTALSRLAANLLPSSGALCARIRTGSSNICND